MKPMRLVMTVSVAFAVGLALTACQPENETELADAGVASAGGAVVGSPAEKNAGPPKLAGVFEPAGRIVLRNGMPVALDVGYASLPLDEETGYALDAFPPTIPDTKWHEDAWMVNDCLRCHETGVGNAPVVVHQSMPNILLSAQCRSCHVIEPGKPGVLRADALVVDDFYDSNAFPPMLPNSKSHLDAWTIEDCLMCHQDGTADAPTVVHLDMPRILLKAKCRSCHVQVRSIEGDSPIRD